MVDLGPKTAKIGQRVIILDNINNANVWADICNTISYEILTTFRTNRMMIIVR